MYIQTTILTDLAKTSINTFNVSTETQKIILRHLDVHSNYSLRIDLGKRGFQPNLI